MSTIYDVAINGCGPTGLVSALLIAERGHSVAIMDRHTSVYPLPRAIIFDHEVARILNSINILDTIAPHLSMPGSYQWCNQHYEILFDLAWAHNDSVSGFASSYLFSQPQLEAVLNALAQEHPNITMLRGIEVTGFTQDADAVSVHGVGVSGDAVCVKGYWLIGADGANSAIRRSMGVEFKDLGFNADWLVVDVLPKDGHSLPVDDDLMLQVCDPARPTTVVGSGPGRRRWEFMALEHETIDDLNSEARAWSLLKPWQVTPQNAILERHAVYTFRGAVAEKWHDGRVFIAGDAAHLTPPFAGQGLCAGLRDAMALAFRLDLALKGISTAPLLNSYETERKPHALVWIDNAIELGKVICVLDPREAAQRDAAMKEAREAGLPPPASTILPLLGTGILAAEQHGGTLAAGGQVAIGGRQGHFDDVVGTGFVLLSRAINPADRLSPELATYFGKLGGITAALMPVGEIDDVDGAYGRWLDALGADTVLIRPDFYLFGASDAADAPNDLVRALAEKLAATG